MERMTIAYVLIVLMALLVVGSIWYMAYHSPQRSYRRSVRRQHHANEKRMAARAVERPEPEE